MLLYFIFNKVIPKQLYAYFPLLSDTGNVPHYRQCVSTESVAGVPCHRRAERRYKSESWIQDKHVFERPSLGSTYLRVGPG